MYYNIKLFLNDQKASKQQILRKQYLLQESGYSFGRGFFKLELETMNFVLDVDRKAFYEAKR